MLKILKCLLNEGVLLLVKLETLACNFTKSNTTPWMLYGIMASRAAIAQ